MKLKQSQPNTIPCNIEIDQDYIREIVSRLSFSRVYGTPDNLEARDIVAEELSNAIGLCFETKATSTIFAGDPSTAKILIGAHFDSVPNSPGADDNASAIAVLLAVANIIGAEKLAEVDQKNPDLEALIEDNAIAARLGIVFAAFNSEEYGLAGSREFVGSLGENHLEQVHILEMVGYRDRNPNSQKNPIMDARTGVGLIECPTTGDFLGIVGNDEELVDNVIQKAGLISVPVLGLFVPKNILSPPVSLTPSLSHLFRSDHAPFWEKGIPASMWTDTSEFRNPHYHKETDTPDTLDYEFMAEVAKLLVAVIYGELYDNNQKTN